MSLLKPRQSLFMPVLLAAALVATSGCASRFGANPADHAKEPDVDNTATEKEAPIKGKTSRRTQLATADVIHYQGDSLVYLPRQQRDAAAQPLPYVAADNPYLLQKVQVKHDSVLLFLAAREAWQQQDYIAAREKLTRITEQDHTLSGPWVMLGNIAVKLDQHATAVKHFQQAIAINANNVNAYTALAQVQRYLGQYKASQQTLTQALSLWPDFPEAHYNLAILYDLYLNQSLRAQQHLEAFLFLQPQANKQSIIWFADIAERTGVRHSFIDKQSPESVYLKQAALLNQES